MLYATKIKEIFFHLLKKYFGESWGYFYGCSALPFQQRQNKHHSKMAREVVRIDVNNSGCYDAKSEIKPKGGKNEEA